MTFGRVHIRVVSSDLPSRFRYISSRGIILRNIHQSDDLTASFVVSTRDYPEIRQYLEEKGDQITIISQIGLGIAFKNVIKRPILSFMMVLLLFLTLWIPTRVLFIRVEGNQAVPEQQILQCAELSGIRFGVSVRSLRSERVKNSLLQQINALSWVGVNTKGCVATVSVVERQVAPEIKTDEFEVSSLVASHDAQIQEVTVTAGNPLCKPGDVVSKGQVLISGYTDCGIKIQATRANGEVFGKTVYNKHTLFPAEYRVKAAALAKSKNICLQIGKKEIKICKGSGISGAICDKMYASKYLTLPGGFVLPLGIKVETCVYYRPSEIVLSPEMAQPIMEHQSRAYLLRSMISGQILSQEHNLSQGDGVYVLTGRYVCREMIGRIQYEKIGAYHEQNSRKNRQR